MTGRRERPEPEKTADPHGKNHEKNEKTACLAFVGGGAGKERENSMKRLLAVFLSLCLLCAAAFAEGGVTERGGPHHPGEGIAPGDSGKPSHDGHGSHTLGHPAEGKPPHDGHGSHTPGHPGEGIAPGDSGKPSHDGHGSHTPGYPAYGMPPHDGHGSHTPGYPAYGMPYIPPYSAPHVTAASGTAYVRTNGGRLNMRAYPSRYADVLRTLENGARVTVTGYSGEWTRIRAGGMSGYVMSRYLGRRRAPAPKSYNPPREKTVAEQYATMSAITPRTVTVRPASAESFVNMRWAPSTSEPVIRSYYSGYALTAIAANAEWVQVMDQATSQVGFMMRVYVSGI